MDIVVDVPVILNSVAPEDLYEGDFQTRQALVHALDFTLKGYMYGPVTNKGVITRSIVNIREGAVANTSAPIFERIIVTPSGSVIDTEGFGFSSSLATSTTSFSTSTTNTLNLRLYDKDESNFINLKAPDVLNSNYTLTLPTDDGGEGQVLKTDGNGNLSWVDVSGVTDVFDQIKIQPESAAGVDEYMTEVLGDISGTVSNNELATAHAIKTYANTVTSDAISELDGGTFP